MQEETGLSLTPGCVITAWVVSASYDRFANGAFVPALKLGPKILG
jgi:hypothetical protein